MSHSIYDYLKRRTTQELDCALKILLEDGNLTCSGDKIVMILQILSERDKENPIDISPETMERLAARLREYYGNMES